MFKHTKKAYKHHRLGGQKSEICIITLKCSTKVELQKSERMQSEKLCLHCHRFGHNLYLYGLKKGWKTKRG